MKNILFGSASAILTVVGFSAFKTAKTTATTYYWLYVIQDVPTATVSLDKTTEVVIITINGGFYSGPAATTLLFATASAEESNPSFIACSNGGPNYCMAGFTSSNPKSVVTSTNFTRLAVTIASPIKLGSRE